MMHPCVLRELSDVTAMTLLSLNGHGDWKVCLSAGGKQTSTLPSEKQEWMCRELSATQPHLDPSESIEKLLVLETISRHTWRTRRGSGVTSMDSHGGGHVMCDHPTNFIKLNSWLGRWWESSGYYLPCWCPLNPYRAAEEVWAGWGESGADWKLSEWLGVEGGAQWHEV